jgi:hypothetical protein
VKPSVFCAVAHPAATATPQLLEERYKYREATAAEFAVVHQSSLRRTREAFSKQCSVAAMRNRDVLGRFKQVRARTQLPAAVQCTAC